MIYERKARQVIRELISAGLEIGATKISVIEYDDSETLAAYDSEKSNLRFNECLGQSCPTVNEALPALVNAVFDVDCSVLVFNDPNEVLGIVSIVLEYDRAPDEIISDYSDNFFCGCIVRHAEGVA
jgi:hypothetical protein